MSNRRKLLLDEIPLDSDSDPKRIAPYLAALDYLKAKNAPIFHNPQSVVNRWLDPLTDINFFKNYFGRNFFHFSAKDADRFADYFSFDSLKRLMTSEYLQVQDLRVFSRSGVQLNHEDYINSQKRIDPQQLLKIFFRDRGSMILHKTQTYDSGVAELVSLFYDWLYIKSSVSTVFTLKGEKTLKWHWDTNDFFVVQVEGRKRWDIYESVTRYPVSVDINPVSNLPGKANAKLIKSIILEKGDMLYLPGGFPHNVTSVEDADSLHLTLSLETITWHEMLKRIHKKIIHENISDINFRIPIWQLLAGKATEKDLIHFKKLQKKILKQFSDIDLSEAFDELMIDKELVSPIQLQKAWGSLLRPNKIQAGTSFERTNLKIRIEKYHDFIRTQIGTSILLFDKKALTSLEFVSKTKKFSLNDIPDLGTKKTKIEFVKILMENAAIIFCD